MATPTTSGTYVFTFNDSTKAYTVSGGTPTCATPTFSVSSGSAVSTGTAVTIKVAATPQGMPAGHRAVGINDQHLHLEVPADSPLAVGDLVGLGISHPCTTFDKWRLIYVVDDDYEVVDAVRTFF